MKTTAFKLASLALLLAACTPKQEIKIEPLSRDEIKAINVALRTGRPVEQVLASQNAGEEEPCGPVFFGRNVEGSVSVPEDYNHPEGRKIDVYYYGRIRGNNEPVVFFNGGPASDSHGSAGLLEDFIQNPDAQKVSMIYIDQRGTGCSSPYPTEPTAETVERLTHYTSTEIVKDSEVIREKILGAGSKWKVFGQSYGGLIVHRYALTAPNSIKAAYAHGFSLMKDQNEWLKLRVQSQKRVSELYFNQYPDDRTNLAKIRSLIDENLCFSDDDGTKVCGPKIMDAVTIFLGFSNEWSYLHGTLAGLLQKDQTLEMDNLKKFVRYYVFGVYNNNGLAASVISLTEISSGDSDADSCVKAQKSLEAEGEHPTEWLINECRLLSGMQNSKWDEILKGLHAQFQMTPDDLLMTMQTHPALPFYLYSGEKDVFVPFETFKEEVQTLGTKIHYQQFPNTGHEGFYAEKQVWNDILNPNP